MKAIHTCQSSPPEVVYTEQRMNLANLKWHYIPGEAQRSGKQCAINAFVVIRQSGDFPHSLSDGHKPGLHCQWALSAVTKHRGGHCWPTPGHLSVHYILHISNDLFTNSFIRASCAWADGNTAISGIILEVWGQLSGWGEAGVPRRPLCLLLPTVPAMRCWRTALALPPWSHRHCGWAACCHLVCIADEMIPELDRPHYLWLPVSRLKCAHLLSVVRRCPLHWPMAHLCVGLGWAPYGASQVRREAHPSCRLLPFSPEENSLTVHRRGKISPQTSESAVLLRAWGTNFPPKHHSAMCMCTHIYSWYALTHSQPRLTHLRGSAWSTQPCVLLTPLPSPGACFSQCPKKSCLYVIPQPKLQGIQPSSLWR